MALFDFLCTTCRRIEPDVRVEHGHAVELDCLDCGNPMRRLPGVPAPAIFTSGGTGASRG